MKFRFQSILDLRIRQRDEAALDLGKVNQAIAKVESDMVEVDAQIASSADDSASRVGNVSVDRLLNRGRYGLQLSADRYALVQTLEKLQAEHDLRRQRLAAAQTEVKKFELLSDRQKADEADQRNRREQSSSDEAAARLFAASRAQR